MYEKYTLQAVPSPTYRELLGTAICVFNSNNQFIIEIYLSIENSKSWYDLNDQMSGKVLESIKPMLVKDGDDSIPELYANLIQKRNRIIHSFQITNGSEQLLRTKDKLNNQYNITEQYLLDFIHENQVLSNLLHNFRGR